MQCYMQMAMQTIQVDEPYIGPVSICLIIVCIITFWPLAFIVCCHPCDKRKVTKAIGPGGALIATAV